MNKALAKEAAAALVSDGATVMIGGFMGVGSPHRLIDALVSLGRKDLTVIANDTARPGVGIGKLIDARAVRHLIVSHIGTNPETQRQMISGELTVDLVPQGTLAEQIRAAGFGLGGVLTPTGVGTMIAEGKTTIAVDGKTFLLEKPLRADFALVGCHRADYLGNLDYCLTARNFNPLIAMAAGTVIAEPDIVVPVGVIPPDGVVTPHTLVDHFITGGLRHG